MKRIMAALMAGLCALVPLIGEGAANNAIIVHAPIRESGNVFVGILTEAQFDFMMAETDEKEEPVYAREYTVDSGILSSDGGFTIRDLPDGEYALLVYIDRNGNGDMDEGLLGPNEPWGMSRLDRLPFMRAPKFAEVSFGLENGQTRRITVKLAKK